MKPIALTLAAAVPFGFAGYLVTEKVLGMPAEEVRIMGGILLFVGAGSAVTSFAWHWPKGRIERDTAEAVAAARRRHRAARSSRAREAAAAIEETDAVPAAAQASLWPSGQPSDLEPELEQPAADEDHQEAAEAPKSPAEMFAIIDGHGAAAQASIDAMRAMRQILYDTYPQLDERPARHSAVAETEARPVSAAELEAMRAVVRAAREAYVDPYLAPAAPAAEPTPEMDEQLRVTSVTLTPPAALQARAADVSLEDLYAGLRPASADDTAVLDREVMARFWSAQNATTP